MVFALKKFVVLAFVFFFLAFARANSLNLTLDSTMQIGFPLGVVGNLTDGGAPVNGTACTVLTQTNDTGALVDLKTYNPNEAIYPNEATLKTNAGGGLYYLLKIDDRYFVNGFYKVKVDCGGTIAMANFQVLPATNFSVFNFLFSFKDNAAVWIVGAGLIVVFAGFAAFLFNGKFK